MYKRQDCTNDKDRKRRRNKSIEKVTLPAVGTVHVKAPNFDGSSHWATYLRQFEAAAVSYTHLDVYKRQ